MKNNERRPRPGRKAAYDKYDLRRDAVWQDHKLCFRGQILAEIVPDTKYPQMWRVKLPSGYLSDMVNLPRAKDAALSLVVASR